VPASNIHSRHVKGAGEGRPYRVPRNGNDNRSGGIKLDTYSNRQWSVAHSMQTHDKSSMPDTCHLPCTSEEGLIHIWFIHNISQGDTTHDKFACGRRRKCYLHQGLHTVGTCCYVYLAGLGPTKYPVIESCLYASIRLRWLLANLSIRRLS
jgi:hypothetical protein